MQLLHLFGLFGLVHRIVAADRNHITLTLNGAKDVPVRGFLLSENKACDGAPMNDVRIMTKLASIEKKINQLDTVMSKVDRLKEVTNTSTHRLTAIENGLKDIKKDVRDIPFSTVYRETTGYTGCYKDCGGRMLNAKSNFILERVFAETQWTLLNFHEYLKVNVICHVVKKRTECAAAGVGIPYTTFERNTYIKQRNTPKLD
ncbi:unnamed protein product [Mytilus coruscus]|uniref:Uncharacterized protein n=1 Tax=Mytilus coruscus TaxID=42192 RepID=A0A6J8CH88_MYTCO|nr:unnamed protein product [Mytilus coruscus]